MAKISQTKNLLRVGKEPVVILPLKKWKEIEETIEDLEDAVKFNIAYKESRNKKIIDLKGLRKEHNLK